jgi:hypothetical protein
VKRILLLATALLAASCGDRDPSYDRALPTQVQSVGLEGHVALVDGPAERIVLLTPRFDQELDRQIIPVGRGVIRVEASPDGKRLFVLTTGDIPRRKDRDQKPELTVIENGAAKRYALESPHSGFAIDPLGRWVALFAAPQAGGQATFVEIPNEIVFVDLEAPIEAAVTPRTLRSFGGRPQRLSFTPALSLPGGQRRLAVVETDQDLSILDLDNVAAKPPRPEITLRLTSGGSNVALRPAAVAFDDGEPSRNDDSRIGVRIAGNPNVFTYTFVAQNPGTTTTDPNTVPNDFRAEPNLTDVGGAPEDIVFVRTEAGVRLAAIVPSIASAVLVDPATSIASKVEMGASFTKISLITNVVGGADGADTALLYGAGSNGVAFWSLGRATGQTYRTVEVVPLNIPVASIVDVPPPKPELKVLQGSNANAFFVLNLASRTASPLTTLGAPTLHVSRDGQRLWAFQRASSQLSQIALDNLHPTPLPLDRPIDAVYDLARADGGRSLVAIDARGGVGATVLDALAPDTTTSRSYYGLLLEDL